MEDFKAEIRNEACDSYDVYVFEIIASSQKPKNRKLINFYGVSNEKDHQLEF